MKKRVFCALMFFILIASVFSLAPAALAAEDIPEIGISSISCKKDQYVEVIVSAKNFAGVSSGNFFITFDGDCLEYMDYEEAKDVSKAGVMIEAGFNGVEIGCSFIHLYAIDEKYNDMELFRIIFKAKENGTGTLKLEIESIEKDEDPVEGLTKKVFSDVVINDSVTPMNVVDYSPESGGESNIRKILLIAGIVVIGIIGLAVVISIVRKKTPGDESGAEIDSAPNAENEPPNESGTAIGEGPPEEGDDATDENPEDTD